MYQLKTYKPTLKSQFLSGNVRSSSIFYKKRQDPAIRGKLALDENGLDTYNCNTNIVNIYKKHRS